MPRVLCFLLIPMFLFAKNFDADYQATTSSDPSGMIEGIINVVTGNISLNEPDIIIEGKEPIVFTRNYVNITSMSDGTANLFGSNDTQKEEYKKAGWSFVKHIKAHRNWDQNIGDRLDIFDPNGNILKYDLDHNTYKDLENGQFKTLSLRNFVISGFSNTSTGIISGRNNFKNNIVSMQDPNHIHVKAADGTNRYYSRSKGDYHPYTLKLEKLPNGNQVHYSYDKYDNLIKIKTTNPKGDKTYAELSISRNHPDPKYDEKNEDKYNFKISSWLNDKKVSYRFIKHKIKINSKTKYENPFFLLENINATHSSEKITYHRDFKRTNPLLNEYIFVSSKNKKYKVYYYFAGQKNMDDIGNITIKDDDKKFQKVSSLWAQVWKEKDETLYITHRFYYDKVGEYQKSNGKTKVKDAYNNDTIYSYDKNFRLVDIKRYQNINNAQVLKNSERFIWGKDKEDGFLLGKIFYDEKNVPIKAIRNIYDPRGNILKERTFGNISGKNQIPLTLNGDFTPLNNGIDSSITEYTYTTNDLIKSITEPNGLKQEYTYWKGTDLPKTKFLIHNDIIIQRTFYEYDDDNILILEIQDDGISKDKDDLTNVTSRLIRRITPRNAYPYGLTDVLEELYLDLKTKKEILIKKEKYEYSNDCKITKKKVYGSNDKLEYTLTYTYEKDNLTSETNPRGDIAKYGYDEANNKNYEKDFFNNEIVFKYDSCNRMISKTINNKYTQKFEYDFKHNKTKQTDIYGNETNYEYDAVGNLIKEILPKVEDEMGRLTNPKIEYQYDSFGNQTLKKDPNGNITKTSYNIFNKPITITYPDGTSEKYEYNLNGTLKNYINQTGAKNEYEYDYLNRVTSKKIFYSDNDLSEENFEYDAFNLTKKVDPEDNYTIYKYDGANRKISEEVFSNNKELLSIEEIEYDSSGFISKKTLGKSLFIYYTRDDLGRITKVEKKNFKDELLSFQEYDYDESGNQHITISYVNSDKLTNCTKSTTTKEFDSLNREIKQIDALDNVWITNYIDKNEKIIEKINPLSQKVKTTYDVLGREKIIEHINPEGNIISLEEKFYDLNNNLIKQISNIYYKAEVIKKIITSWKYDNMNRITSLTEADGSDLSKTTEYTYNALGLLEKTINPDGIEITNKYDNLGNKIKFYSSKKDIDYIFSYNKLNQIKEAKQRDNNFSISRKYDAKNNLLEEVFSNGLKIINKYDLLQNRTKCIYPDRSYVEYIYDPLNLTKVIRKDPYGNILYSHKFLKYDLSLNLLKEDLIDNAGIISYDLDPLSQIIAIKTPYHQQTVKYDEIGRMENTTFEGFLDDTCNYSYDDLNQLTSETGLFSNNYEFDSNYNRLQKNSNSYQINDLNQVLSTEEDKFTYDENGNPLKQITKDSEISYKYDSLDRLIKIEKENDYILEFTYDPFNRRISKRTQKYSFGNWYEEAFRYFLYEDQNEIGSFDKNLNQKELRVLSDTESAEIGSAISFEIDGHFGRYYYAPIYDISQNVISLIYNGSLYEHYRYSSFGERKIFSSWGKELKTSQINNPWQYSSKRIDEESQLVFFGRRYYNPKLGRWLTCDPKGFVDGLNLYSYVFNDPLVNVDLYGLMTNVFAAPTFNVNFDTSNISAGILHESANFAADTGVFISHIGFGISSPFLWGYHSMFGGSLKEDYSRHLTETQHIKFVVENFMQRMIPADQATKSYQYSRMITGATYDGMAIGSMTYGGMRLIFQTANSLKSVGLLKSFKMQSRSELGALKDLNTRDYSGIDVEKIVNDVKNYAKKDLISLKRIHVTKEIQKWLGSNYKNITNKAGDKIFLSNNKIKRVRFDFNKTFPHNNLHMHIEEFINGEWKSYGNQIYPSDLPKN